MQYVCAIYRISLTLLSDHREENFMTECFKSIQYERNRKRNGCSVTDFCYENAKKAHEFHKSFPEYSVTPLVPLLHFAESVGLKKVYVKDESFRFGLNAFKVLGGSYAIGNYIAKMLGKDLQELSYENITDDNTREKLGEITFVTATDGNHGRGIAWTANRLKQKSVVYMPKGSSVERLNNIKALGSDASITELNYDDAVRLADTNAEKYGWVMVQDTAWDGYEEIPKWIMQGYTTMAYETLKQLNGEKPTHIFIQAGVGALAGGLTGFFADLYRNEDRPIITIVEPDKADCIYRTAEADDGKLHYVKGEMNSIMAGLCCGEPCSIGWNILHDYADNFVSVPDYVAAEGMRILGNPLFDDTRIISGESGASTFGLLAEVMRNKKLEWLRDRLKLRADSKVLCFSTEGDTDRENYRRIVWDGLYPGF